ncbi:MAG: Hsp20/alpha crystallin family protein [Thiohalomonadaceae bacterium]
MSTLDQLRHGLQRAFENLSEGWQELRDRTAQALTRFHPARRDVQSPEDRVALHSSRWGLLAADVREEEDQIVVRMEAPGMESADFDLSVVDRRLLLVRGEKRVQREETRGHYVLMESAYGRFERAIPLPADVDETRTKAAYQRGVLRVILPKLKTGTRRRITVQVD